MGYTKNALAGFSGQTAIKILGNALILLKIAIVARILSPTDFGLFSLVVIALGLTEAFTQTGVNTTLIQSKHPVSYFVNTAWVIAIVRGILISLLMVTMGWGMSHYYDQPILLVLVCLAALIPVIKGFINPTIIEMYKELRFLQDSFYRFSLVVVENLAVIGLVLAFRSIEAWVAGLIVSAVFEVVISFVFFKVKPKFQYLPQRAALIFEQTKVLSISSFLSYLLENVDNLLIGKIVGQYGLGLYQPTYSLAHEPNYEIAKSVHHGTLPVYTKIVDDRKRLLKAFLKTSLLTLIIGVGLSLPLFIFPNLIVGIILGEQWQGAVSLLQWLTLAGILQAVSLVFYTPLIAQKKVGIMNWHMALNCILLVSLIIVLGQRYGLFGAVLGVVISRLISLPFLAFLSFKQLR